MAYYDTPVRASDLRIRAYWKIITIVNQSIYFCLGFSPMFVNPENTSKFML